jgi:hypothetical protein
MAQRDRHAGPRIARGAQYAQRGEYSHNTGAEGQFSTPRLITECFYLVIRPISPNGTLQRVIIAIDDAPEPDTAEQRKGRPLLH